jgi:HlyD family secretion protein
MRYALTLLLGSALGLGGYYLWDRADRPAARPTRLSSGHAESGPAGEPAGLVVAMGRLVPRKGIIDVTGPPEARIVAYADGVTEGAVVAAGDPLVHLDRELAELELAALRAKKADTQEQAAAAVAAADAAIKAAQRLLERSRQDSPQIQSQQQLIDLQERNLEAARRQLANLEAVSGVVADQAIEQQRLLVQKAETELETARNTLEQMQITQDASRDAAETELELAQAERLKADTLVPARTLDGEIALAEYRLDQMTVKAPVGGTVLKTLLHRGETVGPRPVVRMADLSDMLCIAEVYEADRGTVRVGQRVVITNPAFTGEGADGPDRLTGTVEQVGRVIGRTTLDEIDPYKPQDRHVFEVTIRLDDDSQELARGFVNLQVQVQIGGPSPSSSGRDDADKPGTQTAKVNRG